MAQTVKTETCSQRVREVTLSCWFWLDSDYMAGFRKLGGKTNQKISMGTTWRRCSEKRYKNGLIYLLAVRIKDIYESSRSEGLGAGQGLWKVGTSVRKSILHSTCLCLRMKCYLGNLEATPESSVLWPALAQSRRGAGSVEVSDHLFCVNMLYSEDPRGWG